MLVEPDGGEDTACVPGAAFGGSHCTSGKGNRDPVGGPESLHARVCPKMVAIRSAVGMLWTVADAGVTRALSAAFAAPVLSCLAVVFGFSGDDELPKSNVSMEGNLYIARESVFFCCVVPDIKLAIVLDLLAFFTLTAPVSVVLEPFRAARPGHFAGALLAAIQPHSVGPSGSGGVRSIAILS